VPDDAREWTAHAAGATLSSTIVKLYLSADMEGIAGVAHWDDVSKAAPTEYRAFQDEMTAEVAAACEACVAAGATEIWVKDAHATGRNIIAERLPREVRLIRGWSGHPYMMVQELDASFDALLFVGYHSRAGGDGHPLAHTMSSATYLWVKVDGVLASEFLLHSLVGHELGVPSVFLSGDEALCEHVRALDPAVHTVAVTRGVGNSTISAHPAVARERIREGVRAALDRDVRALRRSLPGEFTLELGFRDPFIAYRASFYPGAERVDERTVRFRAARFFDCMRMMLFAK
jgi:D-amino peptidase